MADSETIRNASTKRFAPDVDALAAEIGELIDHGRGLDLIQVDANKGLTQAKIEVAETALLERLRALESIAHLGPAETARAAVLVLGLMADIFADTMSWVDRTPRGSGPARWTVEEHESRFAALSLQLLNFVTRDAPEHRDGVLARNYLILNAARDAAEEAEKLLALYERAA